MTYTTARKTLRAVNMCIRRFDGEYRVQLAESNREETAYYTDDLQDAVDTGLDMRRIARNLF